MYLTFFLSGAGKHGNGETPSGHLGNNKDHNGGIPFIFPVLRIITGLFLCY